MERMKDIIILTFVFLYLNIREIDAACKGSVTFYWKEDPTARDENSRNWGELEEEKKFVGSKSRLSTFFDTDRAYAFKVEGDCCWEMFSEKAFKGDSKKLVPKLNSGFAGIPGYPKFKANSLKKVPC